MTTPFRPKREEVYFQLSDGKVGYNEEIMVAEMLADYILWVGPAKDVYNGRDPEETTSLSVMCSDTFAYACADEEPLPFEEIPNLYKMYKEHGDWGALRWCALRRGVQPLPEIVELMKKNNAWDLELEALTPYGIKGKLVKWLK